jgi:hypothetical protein
VQALRLLAVRAKAVIQAFPEQNAHDLVVRNVFVNKVAEELNLSEKDWTFENLIMAKMVCNHKLYRPVIISRLVRLMNAA